MDGFLHAAPRPFVDEAFASWMQRVCARHACSLNWLTRYLQMAAVDDLDLNLRPKHLARLTEVTGSLEDWGFWALYRESARRRSDVHLNRKALAQRSYRWCPACLASDKDPYFRLAWRFGAESCFVHGTPLTTECHGCGHHPNLNVTVHRTALDLSHCQYCGSWLGEDTPVRPTKARAQWLKELEPGIVATERDLTKRLKAVKRSLFPPKKGKKKGPEQPPAPKKRKPLSPIWEIKREYRPERDELTLVLDGRQFHEPMDGARKKWSASIPRGSKARSVMAAALQMVRMQKRAEPEEARRMAEGQCDGGAREPD